MRSFNVLPEYSYQGCSLDHLNLLPLFPTNRNNVEIQQCPLAEIVGLRRGEGGGGGGGEGRERQRVREDASWLILICISTSKVERLKTSKMEGTQLINCYSSQLMWSGREGIASCSLVGWPSLVG